MLTVDKMVKKTKFLCLPSFYLTLSYSIQCQIDILQIGGINRIGA